MIWRLLKSKLQDIVLGKFQRNSLDYHECSSSVVVCNVFLGSIVYPKSQKGNKIEKILHRTRALQEQSCCLTDMQTMLFFTHATTVTSPDRRKPSYRDRH